MGTEYEMYKQTHSVLITRIKHKVKAVLELLQMDVLKKKKVAADEYEVDISLNLDETLDALSETLICETVFQAACEYYGPSCPFGVSDVSILPTGNDKPGAHVHIGFFRDEKKK